MAERGADHEGEEAERRAEFVLNLRQHGIRDVAVLRAIETVPRSLFVPAALAAHAYDDNALPIDCGQTISQPSLVAYMTAALQVRPEHVVLEVGMGSGYQAAVLARLVRQVYTIDRYRTLVAAATARLEALGIANVAARAGDGALGWPEAAPFDRIMVTAAAPEVPPGLVDQLAEGGVMILPVGPAGGAQELVRVEKVAGAVHEASLLPVRFVPLVPGRANAL
jgi:protein-L-isoaspartate(D-aspartate) O-methyltransferase